VKLHVPFESTLILVCVADRILIAIVPISVLSIFNTAMKIHIAALWLSTFLLQACAAQASKIPLIEQGIYHPAPPFVDLKQSIYVRERERWLLPRITDASDSIVRFLLDINNPNGSSAFNVRHVMDESRKILRLPPLATSPLKGRYVFRTLFCWSSDNRDQLGFLVEWADPTTKLRYTDSYVFARHGSSWDFQKHGSAAPRYWTQTIRYVQRECPV
jgi:hypothetical protein